MSKITQITIKKSKPEATGLKGQFFQQPLTGCDLFVGENGTGKTTRLFAILLAMEGMASTQTDSRRIYLGEPAVGTFVELAVENRGRTAYLTRDLGAVRGKAVTEADTEARALLGKPPVAWDLKDFAASTPGDRTKVMEAITRAASDSLRWTGKKAVSHIKMLLDPDEKGIRNSALERFVERTGLDNIDATEFLRLALKWVEEEYRITNADQRSAKAYMDGFISVAIDDLGDKAADEKELSRLQNRLAELGQISKRINEIRQEKMIWQNEVARMQKQLQQIREKGEELKKPEEAPKNDITFEQQSLEAAKQAKSSSSARDEGKIQELGAKVESLDADVIRIQSHIDDLMKQRSEIQSKRDQLQKRYAELLASIGILSSQKSGKCLHCGADDPFKITDEIAKLKAEEERIKADAAQHSFDDVDGKILLSEKLLKVAEKGLAEKIAELKHMESLPTNEEISEQEKKAVERAELALQLAIQRQKEALESWNKREEKRQRDLEQARENYSEIRKNLSELTSRQFPAEPEESEEIPQIQMKIAGIRERQTKRMRAEEKQRQAAEALAKHQKASVAFMDVKEFKKAIQKTTDDLGKMAYAPIQNALNDLIEHIPGLPVPFFDDPETFGAVNRWGVKVPFHALSESEKRITAAAMSYALSVVSNQPCRMVLLDGIEVIQADHREPLIRAFVSAQSRGLVDNVVMTMAVSGDDAVPEIEGLKTWRLYQIEQSQHIEKPTQPEIAPAKEFFESFGSGDPSDLDEIPF